MRARILAVAAGVAVALLVVSGSGAASGPKLDLSTPQAIDAYLGSKGIDPATVVRQVGLRNYAGPASGCPGIGWNCTTAPQVAQIALAGGENVVTCTDASCLILQAGPSGTNHAACKQHLNTEPSAAQSCVIVQTGDRNTARVEQVIDQSNGPTQDASQTAEVDQNATERNESQIHQKVKQRTSAGPTQTQDAYQLADVDQDASGSENFSHVHQSQDQDESGAASTQLQNTNSPQTCFNKTANQCARVRQDISASAGGKNASHLHQAIGERQSTSASPATQTQGLPTNGNEGDIHQVNPPDVGQNHDIAHQDLRQRQSGPDGTTTQRQDTDPSCCGVSQIGGAINREFITQSTTQSASEDNAIQTAGLFGQVHQVDEGGELTFAQATSQDNKCRISHHGRNNSGGSHFSSEGEGAECASLFRNTTCTSGPVNPDITVAQAETEPCVSFGSGDVEVESFALPATSGLAIAMPDYDAEPSDYAAPGR